MTPFLPLVPIRKEIYAREYLIPAECFPCNEPVTLYAECSHTSEIERDCGFYRLSFLFSVGGYPTRDHLIDLYFGSQSMSRVDIDRTIDDYARSQIDADFPLFVERYLEKEELWEQAQIAEDFGCLDCDDFGSNDSDEN